MHFSLVCDFLAGYEYLLLSNISLEILQLAHKIITVCSMHTSGNFLQENMEMYDKYQRIYIGCSASELFSISKAI